MSLFGHGVLILWVGSSLSSRGMTYLLVVDSFIYFTGGNVTNSALSVMHSTSSLFA